MRVCNWFKYSISVSVSHKRFGFYGTQDTPFFNNDSAYGFKHQFFVCSERTQFHIGLKRHRTDLVFKWTWVHVEVALRKKNAFILKALFQRINYLNTDL